jgi:AraC-like DNA-binding protein
MAHIVGLVGDREARARIAQGLRGHAEITFCGGAAELLDALAHTFVTAVVVEVRECGGVSTTSVIRSLREGYPSVPVVAYCSLTAATPHDILTAAKAGASGLVLRGVDDTGVALRTALMSAADDCVARSVMRALEEAAPGSVRPILEYCILHARNAPSVQDVARALGISRKTLVNRLGAAGMPAPSAVIGWCRLLQASRLIEDPKRPVEQIAHELDFPSGAALRNMLKRYTGLQPREVRENGGLRCVLHAFQRALASRRPHPTGIG